MVNIVKFETYFRNLPRFFSNSKVSPAAGIRTYASETRGKTEGRTAMPNHVINEIRLKTNPKTLSRILRDICREDLDENGNKIPAYGTIDFNRIVPMPEDLNIEAGSKTFMAVEVRLTALNPDVDWFGDPEEKMEKKEYEDLLFRINEARIFSRHVGDLRPESLTEEALGFPPADAMKMGKQAIRNFETYGALTWYEWRTNPDHWNTKWNAYDCEYLGAGVLRFQTAWSAPHPVIRALASAYPEVCITHEWADEDIGYNCGRVRYEHGLPAEQYTPLTRKESTFFAEGLWEGVGDGEYAYRSAEQTAAESGIRQVEG